MEKERGCGWPEIAMTIAQAMDSPGRSVPLDACEGMVSGEFIYIYPPGIPIVAPGEVLKPELVEMISSISARAFRSRERRIRRWRRF